MNRAVAVRHSDDKAPFNLPTYFFDGFWSGSDVGQQLTAKRCLVNAWSRRLNKCSEPRKNEKKAAGCHAKDNAQVSCERCATLRYREARVCQREGQTAEKACAKPPRAAWVCKAGFSMGFMLPARYNSPKSTTAELQGGRTSEFVRSRAVRDAICGGKSWWKLGAGPPPDN